MIEDDDGTVAQLRAPVATVYRAPRAEFVTHSNVDRWERECLGVCGHGRSPSLQCRTCRDVDQVILAVGAGSSVQVYPSR